VARSPGLPEGFRHPALIGDTARALDARPAAERYAGVPRLEEVVMPNASVPIVPSKLAHFVLRTRRYAELIAWYRTVLGAKPVFESPFITFLTWDSEHHRIAIANAPHFKDRPDDAVGLDHIAVTLPSAIDLLRSYERLRDLGIEPATPIHHGLTLSMYYLDPDKNEIELQVDAFDSEEELKAFFGTDAFAKNPIGVLYDPEALLARWKAGATEKELRAPIAGPPPGPGAFEPH
jgi:catechol 2,3-dioxygenase-like lactoylglutathione lyase family enzyme